MPDLNCIVVTPEATALEQSAEFVALPLYDGEIGIAPGHSPMIGRLGFGEMRLRGKGGVQRYYVDGGFVQIADNVVSVLTSRAIPAHEVDTQKAKAQLEEARGQSSNTPELMEIRDRTVSQARAMIRVSQKSDAKN